MALSLDYIGKFIIVMVTVSVAITLIVNWQGDIDLDFIHGENGDPTDMEIVEMDAEDGGVDRIRILVEECYDRSREFSHQSFECFMAVQTGGEEFDFNEGDLEDEVRADMDDDLVNVDETGNEINDATNVLVRYEVGEGIVVEKVS